jgi:hypothetical protein
MELSKGQLIKARNGQQTDQYDDKGKPVWGTKDGQPICNAPKRKKPGEFCERAYPFLGDSGRCDLHNRGQVNGVGHPNAKSLKYSKTFRHLNLPSRYHKSIKQSMKRPDQIEHRNEVSLIDARMDELKAALTDDSLEALVAHRDDIRAKWRLFNEAVASKDGDLINTARARLHAAITRGVDDDETWDKIIDLAMKRRQFVDSETKRRVQNEQMVPLTLLQDYTIKAIHSLRSAVIENTRIYAERCIDRMRLGLIEAKVDPELINVVMAVVATEVQSHFDTAARMMLSDASRGVAALYSARQIPERLG